MKYLTFPMAILKDSIRDVGKAAYNACCYCLYDYCHKKEQNYGDLLEEAENAFGVKYVNGKEAYNIGKKVFESVPVKSPKTSISQNLILDFCLNEKSEFEVACFLAFAATKSILQTQAYIKITNEYLINRMAGNPSKGGVIPEEIKPYSKRYQLDKIKTELQLNWGLKLYANHTRGFYISYAFSLEKLVLEVEKRRKRFKENELIRQKEEARKLALNQIFNENI